MTVLRFVWVNFGLFVFAFYFVSFGFVFFWGLQGLLVFVSIRVVSFRVISLHLFRFIYLVWFVFGFILILIHFVSPYSVVFIVISKLVLMQTT